MNDKSDIEDNLNNIEEDIEMIKPKVLQMEKDNNLIEFRLTEMENTTDNTTKSVEKQKG